MSFIGFIKSFVRTTRRGAQIAQSVVDEGGGILSTVEYLSASGDDAPPLPNDFAACMNIPRSGGHVAVAVADTKNAGVAQEGEKRIYARNSGGDVVGAVYLEGDGTITLSNDNGLIELLPDGNVHVSGDLVVDGNITAAEGTFDGVVSSTHVHGGVETGGGQTGGPQ